MADPTQTAATSIPDVAHLLAALGGSIVGLKGMPGATWCERAANLLMGFLSAVYLGPALAEWLSLSSPRVVAGVIFACGAGGLVILGGVIDGLKAVPWGGVVADLIDRLKSLLPRRS